MRKQITGSLKKEEKIDVLKYIYDDNAHEAIKFGSCLLIEPNHKMVMSQNIK